MANEWQTLTLREAGVSLIDCDHRTPPATDDGFPYVAIPQLRDGRIELRDARRISPAHFYEWTRKAKPTAHDVVLSRRCNPGETGFVPPKSEFALGQNLVLLRSDGSRIHPPFLRWLTRSPAWWIEVGKFLNVGAVFDSLKCADVPRFELPVPPVDQQRAIARILGTLDDKVELNRRMNETLEEMARTVFNAWFVDGKVKAENLTEWPTHPLADCVDVARGLSYKGDGLADTGVPMHNLNSIYEGGGYKHDGIKYYDGAYKPHHLVKAGDLIIANTEQGHDRLLIGHAAIVPERYGDQSLFSHHLYRVRPKTGRHLTPEYLCHLLNSREMHDIVSGYANGTTVNMLSMDGLQLPVIRVPPKDRLDSFTHFARSVRLRQEAMIEESRTLSALRDTLLPKLISGELRVQNAQKSSTRGI